MMPNRSGLLRAGLVVLMIFLAIHCSGCRHYVTIPNAAPPPVAGATLLIQFAWTASPEDNLGTNRTVILSGKQVAVAVDSRYVTCFGADRTATGCQFIGEFNTTSVFTPGLEYDGNETITNAQLGRWEVTAAGESSGGANASQTCSADVDSNRLVTIKISIGVDPGCAVQ